MATKEPQRNVYVGHRYVPIILGEWDKALTYEGLSIVTYQGNSYTSKKRVPVGIEIGNETYWVITGNYNAQIEQYRQDVKRNTEELNAFKVETTEELLDLSDRLVQTEFKTADVVSSLTYGIKGDGTDETLKFQKLLDENVGKKIVIAPPETKLVLGTIIPPSNTLIVFSYGMTVEIAPGLLPGEKWWKFGGKKNVTLIGKKVTFQMLKDEYTVGEHRHCFDMYGDTENIWFEGLTAKGSGGDGWYIGTGSENMAMQNKNITLIDCVSDDNRRQGMSVTNVDGLYVLRSKFDNTRGTPPQAGIDFEPNGAAAKLKNIVIDSCQFNNNFRAGVEIFLNHLNETSDPVDMKIINCTGVGNGFGYYVRYIKKGTKGKIDIINCITTEDRWTGYRELDVEESELQVNVNLSVVNANTAGGSSIEYGFGSAFLITHDILGVKGGATDFINCSIRDTRPVRMTIRDFAFDVLSDMTKSAIIRNPKSDQPLNVYITSKYKVNLALVEDRFKLRRKDFTANSSSSYNNLYPNELNKIISNKGATGSVAFRLPPALPYHIYRFFVEETAAGSFSLQTQYGTGIVGHEGKNLGGLKGSSIVLKGREDGLYEIIEQTGTWTPFVI